MYLFNNDSLHFLYIGMCHISTNLCIHNNVKENYLACITYYTRNILVFRNVSNIEKIT